MVIQGRIKNLGFPMAQSGCTAVYVDKSRIVRALTSPKTDCFVFRFRDPRAQSLVHKPAFDLCLKHFTERDDHQEHAQVCWSPGGGARQSKFAVP